MKTLPCLIIVALLGVTAQVRAASQHVIPAPPGSAAFGANITVLPNGHFIVRDPGFDLSGVLTDVGAVYLFRPDGTLVSRLTGSTTGDQVGSGGVTILVNGNFVVRSPLWDNGAAVDAGAVTWGSATSGFLGGVIVSVSTANSLTGSTTVDSVGLSFSSVIPLTNGNYIVRSTDWDNGLITDAGAVTWGNGFTGTTGAISPSNSLVGSSTNDQVGSTLGVALTNGHYVASSFLWDNGVISNAGAVTWINGNGGTVGPISAANSLVGSTANDQVGSMGIRALTNGNYVVCSPTWDDGAVTNAGAATWGNGNGGTVGPLSAANSLVGTTANDRVGLNSATALTNGHYVVSSQNWNNGPATGAGAATWGNGNGGTVGPVSAANSLVGSTANDAIGSSDVVALVNGHYVVCSTSWDNGLVSNAGAVTWGNGNGGTIGPVSTANSLHGTSPNDGVGSIAIPLTTGHFVVRSDQWNNGAANVAGAVTWCNGNGGTVGPVSSTNSLVGSTAFDRVGNDGVLALTNGHYIVQSSEWDNGPVTDVGAATWGNGNGGTVGPVSSTNSLVGSTSNDRVGSKTPALLNNGNYVICSPLWDNGGATNAGAATWANGNSGIVGPVSAANSLVGTTTGDEVGDDGVHALANGNYIVRSSTWDNGPIVNAGAVTWGSGTVGVRGPVSAVNSMVGATNSDFIGAIGVTVLTNGNYIVRSQAFDNGSLVDAGAVTLGDGAFGSTGFPSPSNSVMGGTALAAVNIADFLYPTGQMVVGSPNEQRIILFGNRLTSVAFVRGSAPGVMDALLAKPGPVAVSAGGTVLFDSALSGPGASGGKNRGVFAIAIPGNPLDLVLQRGDSVAGLGGGLPANAKVSALLSPLHQNPGRGLFQAVVQGTGLTGANNRLLLRDNGSTLNSLLRTGQSHHLYALPYRSLGEVLQSHNADLVTVCYRLTAPGASDTGVVTLRHNGAPTSSGAAPSQEGQASGLLTVGTLGQIGPRAAAGLGGQISFSSIASVTGKAALLRVSESGNAIAADARAGSAAPGIGGATLASFPAFTQLNGETLFKARLSGVPTATNEALYRASDGAPRLRKGDPVSGATITAILRFWPAGADQILALVTLSDKSQALILRQADSQILELARTKKTMPGTGGALLRSISAVDVNPVNGRYCLIGALQNSAANANQALWSGNTSLGFDVPAAEQARRLPVLRLRKGEAYSTPVSVLSTVRSIALQPANDIGGAGGRGLHHAIGADGSLAVTLTTAVNVSHLVLLPP